jgi:hypothetical protein
MRIIIVFLLSILFFSCKTKDVIQSDQLLKFIVILEQPAHPKVLKKDISFDLIAFTGIDVSLNQWAVDFKGMPKDANKLRASLLSHPKVISVFTLAQYEKIKLKNSKKGKDGAFGKKGNSKN